MSAKRFFANSSARYSDLTAPLSLLALLGASGALVAAGKRKREKEKDDSTEVQRRHQSKVEKRWKKEAEKEAERKRLDSHRGMDAKIDRMEAAEGAAILAAQEAKRKKDAPLDSATQSYMAWGKAIEEGKFDTQKYAKTVEEAKKSAPSPMRTPIIFDIPNPWWIPSFSVQEASRLVRAIPSVEVASNRISVPVAKIVATGKMLSFGTVTAWNFGTDANPGAEVRTDGFGGGTINEPDKPSAFVRVNLDTAEASSGMRFPAGLEFTQDGFSSSLGYSVNAYARWDGWNTTVSIDLNYADVDASGAGMKGNISGGVYVEVKPLQVALATTILVLTVAAALSGYPITKEQLCPAFGC